MPNRIPWLLSIATGAMLLGIAAAIWLFSPGRPALRSGTLLPSPRPLPAFRFVSAEGPFTNADLRGHWTLFFPGYTACPDVCPTTLASLHAVAARLPRDRLKVVFLSIDPGRDTPARLASYVRAFDPAFVGITAPEADLERYAKSFGYVFARAPGAGPDGYLMDHSAALILVDPRGRVAGYLSPPFEVAALVADLDQVLGVSGS